MTAEEYHQQQLEELEQRLGEIRSECERLLNDAASLPGGMMVLDSVRTHIYALQHEHDQQANEETTP